MNSRFPLNVAIGPRDNRPDATLPHRFSDRNFSHSLQPILPVAPALGEQRAGVAHVKKLHMPSRPHPEQHPLPEQASQRAKDIHSATFGGEPALTFVPPNTRVI